MYQLWQSVFCALRHFDSSIVLRTLCHVVLTFCSLACKEIDIGGYRGWRLKMIEAFIIILAFTELMYVLLLHAGIFSSKYGPGYRDTDYAMGATTGADPVHKGGAPVAGSRVA